MYTHNTVLVEKYGTARLTTGCVPSARTVGALASKVPTDEYCTLQYFEYSLLYSVLSEITLLRTRSSTAVVRRRLRRGAQPDDDDDDDRALSLSLIHI